MWNIKQINKQKKAEKDTQIQLTKWWVARREVGGGIDKIGKGD